jgi:hypothetical protein
VTPPELSLPGVPLRELEQRWGLSRNGLKARARALGVELERVSSTLTLWPGDFVELGDRLDEHIKAGNPMGTFPGLAPAGTASSGAITKTPPAQSEALATAIAQAIAATTISLPGSAVDPLKRARALAEAADNGLVLTTDELAALGVKGIDGFADGDEAFGYRFYKHQQRNRTLWTVERTIGKPAGNAAPMQSSPVRPVGFAGAIEARCQTISAAIELPCW